jgi:hypothetical protein
MRIRTLVLGVLAGTLLVALALPAGQATTAAQSADARPPMLWKREARPRALRKAAHEADYLLYLLKPDGIDAITYRVERARDATRKARNRVVFQAWMTLHDNENQSAETCEFKIRVRQYRAKNGSELITQAKVAPRVLNCV